MRICHDTVNSRMVDSGYNGIIKIFTRPKVPLYPAIVILEFDKSLLYKETNGLLSKNEHC